MKVICNFETENGKKCNKVVYDNRVDDGVIMNCYCDAHRNYEGGSVRKSDEERILEIVGSLHVVNKDIVARSIGGEPQASLARLKKLCKDKELTIGTAYMIDRKVRIPVFTLPEDAEKYHNKSTERYKSIIMDIE